MTTYDHIIWKEPDPQVFPVYVGLSKLPFDSLCLPIFSCWYRWCFDVCGPESAKPCGDVSLSKNRVPTKNGCLKTRDPCQERNLCPRMGWMVTFARKTFFKVKKPTVSDQCSLTKPPPFLYWIIGIKKKHVFRGSPISPRIPMKNMGLNATLRYAIWGTSFRQQRTVVARRAGAALWHRLRWSGGFWWGVDGDWIYMDIPSSKHRKHVENPWKSIICRWFSQGNHV